MSINNGPDSTKKAGRNSTSTADSGSSATREGSASCPRSPSSSWLSQPERPPECSRLLRSRPSSFLPQATFYPDHSYRYLPFVATTGTGEGRGYRCCISEKNCLYLLQKRLF